MAGFFGDFCTPRSQTVDPRKNVRLSWFYYFEDSDLPVDYYIVQWKLASTSGWGSATAHRVPFPDSSLDIPPYVLAEDQKYSWQVTAYGPDPTTGAIVTRGNHQNMMDTSGYVMLNDNILSSATNALITWTGSIDPGEYDLRVKVRNGFQWSPWSTVRSLKAYDTRKFVLRSGVWWATPLWKKTSGTMNPAK